MSDIIRVYDNLKTGQREFYVDGKLLYSFTKERIEHTARNYPEWGVDHDWGTQPDHPDNKLDPAVEFLTVFEFKLLADDQQHTFGSKVSVSEMHGGVILELFPVRGAMMAPEYARTLGKALLSAADIAERLRDGYRDGEGAL